MVLYRLRPGVQHYAWGDANFLPALLGRDNPDQTPYAELWMGDHPDLPSQVSDGTLATLISRAPEALLGAGVAEEFGGRLPYLIKVLAAARPLSIQAHPTETQAKRGFERENDAGIPLDAPDRSYRDPRAKPELVAALTEFYALVGFRPLSEIASTLAEHPELGRLVPDFEPRPEKLEELYRTVMTIPQFEIDALLAPILARARRGDPGPERHEYWLVRCDETFSRDGRHDRGLLSILLLNLVRLLPGEALFLDAGTLHAYLQGAAVEIMSSSNNVLRGGLTEKHVAIGELLEILRFEGEAASATRPVQVSETERVYPSPAKTFELARIEVDASHPHRSRESRGPEILLVTEADGPLTVTAGTDRVDLGRGQCLFVPCGTGYTVAGQGAVFRAGVPEAEPSFRGRRPSALRFGTSGLRGLVDDITDLEAYVNTRGFLHVLLRRDRARRGDSVAIAGDLRPSTERILAAVARAVRDSGLDVVNLGRIPTPALTWYGLSTGRASIMVTGSHIPFDRNGIKFVKPEGEVLKEDEEAILAAVEQERRQEYLLAPSASLFADDGSFRDRPPPDLPGPRSDGQQAFAKRYLEFFPPAALEGLAVAVFQHSAVGRDLLVEILEGLGADVVGLERSESFVPIDTEDITEERLRDLERMARTAGDGITAIVSTDGDSDRPLVCGVEPGGGIRFVNGDLLGILVADYLEADAVVVPVSANDAVDLWFGKKNTRLKKTRIGSPYVIRGMEELGREGAFRCVVGWEANGGFLTGSDVTLRGRKLAALPTRDAVLPILAVLHAAKESGRSISGLMEKLPSRFGRSGLLDAVERETSLAIVERFSSRGSSRELESVFLRERGFGGIERIDDLDGLRIYFDNGDIAHLRPSGNAPQLRIYAVADSQQRADEIVRLALREPDGILRRLAATVTTRPPTTREAP